MSKKTKRGPKNMRKPHATGSADLSVMNAEALLMKAATEFAFQWGRDQTLHPKIYWLELHLENWGKLARAALAYSERVNPPNADVSDRP
jgi:hypothetical protein